MSITDSRADLEAAKERLAGLSAEQLRLDLEYWSVAAMDHQAEATAIASQYHEARRLQDEAGSWAALVLQEIARRPRGRRGAA